MDKLAIIILAAGKGTRMNSETAKVLHEINGKPMICYVTETAVRIAEEVVVVIGTQADTVRKVVSASFQVKFALQKEQLGTGHAVLCAMPKLEDHVDTVLILCGDVPLITQDTLVELITSHRSSRNDLTILGAYPENPFGYGRLVCDEKGNVLRIVEEADASSEEKNIGLINAGIYVIDRELLEKFLMKIDTNNAQKEMYLTDIVGISTENQLKVGMLACSDVNEMLGINTRKDLQRVEWLVSPNEKP